MTRCAQLGGLRRPSVHDETAEVSIRPTSALIAICLLFALAATAEVKAQEPAERTVTYTVQAGDKLIAIASQLLQDPGLWSEVAQFNRMAQPDRIAIGQSIQIPLRLMRWAPGAAHLVSANGDIQVNGAPAAAGAAIAEGDRLQAGPGSSAVLALEDGSRIQLLPSSLAELIIHRQYGQKDAGGKTHWFAGLLRLTQGAVEAMVTPGVQRAMPLQVTTPTSVVGVRGTHFRVAFDAQARSEVIEGRVVAENPAQASQASLPAGTGAVIRPDVKHIEVKPLLPAPNLGASPAQRQAGQTWNWPAAEGAEAWRVQLAADPNFSQIVRQDRLATPSWAMAGLPLGRWFARVRAIDNVGLEGLDASRALEIVATPVPDWTLRSSTLTLRNGLTRLRWTPVETRARTGGQWRAEVLKNGVAVDATSVPSAENSFTELLQLAPGSYTVHIDGQDAQGIPFQRKIFQLRVPDGWGTSTQDVINPLQLSE
jgi:hypothetical protein